MRHFFVINPLSFHAAGSMEQMLTKIKNVFPSGSQTEYEIYISRYSRDAIAAVNDYISSFPAQETVRVYAVGGDGILFDCLNGMADFPNAEITNVPHGNANDFIRGCFGDDAKERFRDIKELCRASARHIDVMRCDSNYALNEVMLGLSGQCVLYANALFRSEHAELFKRCTSLIYNLCAVRALLTKEVMTQQYQVSLDGNDFSGDYCHIAISNGSCNGNTMLPSPYAKANDGLLNVVFGKSHKPFEVLKTLNDYYKGLFEKYPIYSQALCTKMKVKSDVPIRVEMDGDAFFAEEVSVEVLPGHIKFIVPEGMEFADYSHKAYKFSTSKVDEACAK